MAGLTLGGQQITNNDMLIKGIIESIVTVNQFYASLPFMGIRIACNQYQTDGSFTMSSIHMAREVNGEMISGYGVSSGGDFNTLSKIRDILYVD